MDDDDQKISLGRHYNNPHPTTPSLKHIPASLENQYSGVAKHCSGGIIGADWLLLLTQVKINNFCLNGRGATHGHGDNPHHAFGYFHSCIELIGVCLFNGDQANRDSDNGSKE